MQLYIVATLIKWASHGNRFKSVILRPGGMQTLMSFNGCFGNLMKASGLEVLVGAAFGALTSIMQGMCEINACLSYGDSSLAIQRPQKWSQDIRRNQSVS